MENRWHDHYFKFSDEQEMLDVWPEHMLCVDEHGKKSPNISNSNFAVDIIGTIFSNGDNPQAIPGWHVNMRLRDECTVEDALKPFEIPAPSYPKRVFA